MAWRGSRVIRLEDGLSNCAPGGRRKSRSAPPHRRGIALAWTAIVLLVMILMVGLGIDAGLAALGLHQLQNAVDAGSLAGAQIVKTDADGAVVRSHDVALLNDVMRLPVFLRTTRQPDPFDGAEDAYDILVGRWVSQNHTFFPTLDAPNAVQAVGRRLADLGGPSPPVGLVFGGMAGVPTVDLTRLSVAWCFDSAGAGLICLSPDAVPGLYVYGNAQIDVENGGIHVNSIAMGMKKNAGTHVQGNSVTIDCGYLNVVGSTDPPPLPGEWDSYFGDIDGTYHEFGVQTGVEPIADPVATIMGTDRLDVPMVDGDYLYGTAQFPGSTVTKYLAPITSSCTLGPGYYPGGLRVTSSGVTVTLDPTLNWNAATQGQPIYYFGGGTDGKSGLVVNGGNLIGRGATIYVTKDYVNANGQWGKVDLQGNGTIDLASPADEAGTDVDGMPGIAIWQDPRNPNDVTLNGTVGMYMIGTLYFPPPTHVDIEGTPGKTGNQIICGSLDVTGNATIVVNYDGRNDPFRLIHSVIVE